MARVVAATVTSAAPGGTINFSFEGCGDASTLGTIKVLEPSSLILSGTITSCPGKALFCCWFVPDIVNFQR